MNLVQMALGDLKVAERLISNKAVRGLDVRELHGGAQVFAADDPRAADVYCGALDAGLSRLPGLTNRGYVVRAL